MRDYQAIVERHENHEYSEEVEEKLQRSRQKFQARLAMMDSAQNAEMQHAGDNGGS